MIIEEIGFTLRDGRGAVIRSPRGEDIPGMLEYLYITACETEFLLRYPEECGKYTPEGDRALFERVNASENEAMLVCLVEGRIAGTCSVSRFPHLKLRHRATLAIALTKEFWGLGIGTRLMEELLRIARGWGVMQAELEFIEGNDRARALYERFGFEITGFKPDAIMLKDGRLLKEYAMVKKLG